MVSYGGGLVRDQIRMANMKFLQEDNFYICTCGATAVCLSCVGYADEPEICLSMWSLGFDGPGGRWKEKLRHIWHIIVRGHPYEDSVILSQGDATKMATKLIEFVNRSTGES